MNAATAMILCIATGYYMSLGLTRIDRGWRYILLMLVILPFWTSFLLRVYAWMGLMGSNSWFDNLLTAAWNWLVPQARALNSIPMMHSNFAFNGSRLATVWGGFSTKWYVSRLSNAHHFAHPDLIQGQTGGDPRHQRACHPDRCGGGHLRLHRRLAVEPRRKAPRR